MSDAINRFYNSINEAEIQSQSNLVELFLYYLTVELGQDSATAKEITDCFVACDLKSPKNVGARLSEGLNGKQSKYIKSSRGYKLQRHMREYLSAKLGVEKNTVQTSIALRNLEHKMPAGLAKDFLRETIDCYEVGANRATIIMAWILAMDSMHTYIFNKKLQEFNAVLMLNTDKSLKVKIIIEKNDFTEIKESKFIELCRSANIISNDTRKILDQKLGTRNSCAHPSGLIIKNSKVIDFVEDMVENVILKYLS